MKDDIKYLVLKGLTIIVDGFFVVIGIELIRDSGLNWDSRTSLLMIVAGALCAGYGVKELWKDIK